MEQKRKKFYTLCKDTNLNFTLANYQKFYLRQPLLGLLQYHKPVIVTGTIDINPFDHFYTVKDVKPYYPKYEDTLVTLCYHINLFKDQVNEFIDFTKIPYLNKLFVLICEPYNYIDKDNESRGGLRLTNKLNINPIMYYEDASDILKNISPEKYINFYEYCNGYFLGISSDAITVLEKKEQQHRKYLRKSIKKYDLVHYPFLKKVN